MSRKKPQPKKKQDTKAWQKRDVARKEKQKIHALLQQESPHDSPTAALYPPTEATQ